MKIRRAEFLAAVAITTSATVMQIREHMHPRVPQTPSAEVMSSSCGAMHNGLVPAACESMRDKRQVDRAPQSPHSGPQTWV